MVWTLFHMSLRGGRPFRMSGSGRVAFRDVREAPPGCPGVVERPSQMSGSAQEALPDVRERSEAFRAVREWLGDPP